MQNLIDTLKDEVDQVKSAMLPPILAPLVALLVDLHAAHLAHESRIAALEGELATARAAIDSTPAPVAPATQKAA